MVFRAIVKWISALKRATLPQEKSVNVYQPHLDENCFEMYYYKSFFTVLSTYTV